MSLVLEIEYLTGTCFAAIGPDSSSPDWPPQPDRVFSALVSTWGARGENQNEAHALEWLEKQQAAAVYASDHVPRTSAIRFVPPNDPESGRSGNPDVVPALRRRQPRRFPATRPISPIVRLCWVDARPDGNTFAALQSLAADTAYVGHSASLTRCRFLQTQVPFSLQTTVAVRSVYPGRFSELQNSYQLFVTSGGRRGRPLPGMQVRLQASAAEHLPHAFEDRWLLLEHVAGTMPDIRAVSIISRILRDTLLSGYKRIGLEGNIPEVVSGHAQDGAPTRLPHLAIIPLPFAGFSHSDGHVMGFALVPPRDSRILDDADFRRVLRQLAPMDESRGRRILTVQSKAGSPHGTAFALQLSPTFEAPAGKRSLQPALYTKPARAFASVTPLVLDRHLKEIGPSQTEEIVQQISAACRNIGLPEPQAIIPNKHSAIEGAPSAYPSGKSPEWTQWRLPAFLKSRQLTHSVIRFFEPIQGPLLLCAGRFIGLGLFRPVDREQLS